MSHCPGPHPTSTLSSMTRHFGRALVVLVLAAALAAALGAPTAAADDDVRRSETRTVSRCGRAVLQLRLRSDDGVIDVRFEVDDTRSGAVWRFALVQERRVVWRGRATTAGSRRSLEVRRRLRDLPGSDTVTAQAWGPVGSGCRSSATLGDLG